MLSIEHIIDPVPPADLDRIDLMYVKMFGGFLDMGNGEVALIGLVGYQIFYGDLLKMYVRNKSAVVSHGHPPPHLWYGEPPPPRFSAE